MPDAPRSLDPDAVDAAIQLLLTHARDNSNGRLRYTNIVRWRFGVEAKPFDKHSVRIFIDVDGATLDE